MIEQEGFVQQPTRYIVERLSMVRGLGADSVCYLPGWPLFGAADSVCHLLTCFWPAVADWTLVFSLVVCLDPMTVFLFDDLLLGMAMKGDCKEN